MTEMLKSKSPVDEALALQRPTANGGLVRLALLASPNFEDVWSEPILTDAAPCTNVS